MTEYQRLFLVQARSDLAVFELLLKEPGLPACHFLHYLQMATEMLGKAHAWRSGPQTHTHRAFVGFLRSLATNRQAQEQLGFEGKNANWKHLLRKSIPLAEQIEDLAPALSPDAPNPEYPWPRAAPGSAPAEYDFSLRNDLVKTAHGRQFLELVRRLFATAERYL